MAGDENEAQEVIANLVIERQIEIGHGHLLCLELPANLFMF